MEERRKKVGTLKKPVKEFNRGWRKREVAPVNGNSVSQPTISSKGNKMQSIVSQAKVKFTPYVKPKKVVPKIVIDALDRSHYETLLKGILSVQSVTYSQEDMILYVLDLIDEYNETVVGQSGFIKVERDDYGNIYLTKGEAVTYPCIIAHLDTVHSIIPNKNFKVFESDGKFFAINSEECRRTGIGGDDNVGIFIAMATILSPSFQNVKVALFKDEESGCIGSGRATKEWFDNVSFGLQADRQGYNDFVSSIYGEELYGREFAVAISDILKKYKKEETTGALTDVSQLASLGVDCALVNSSCGYYLPHTDNEYVIIDEVLLTLQLFGDIIKDCYKDGHRYEQKRTTPKPFTNGGGWTDYSVYGYDYNDYDAWGYRKKASEKAQVNSKGQRNITCPYCLEEGIESDYEGWRYCQNCGTYI